MIAAVSFIAQQLKVKGLRRKAIVTFLSLSFTVFLCKNNTGEVPPKTHLTKLTS